MKACGWIVGVLVAFAGSAGSVRADVGPPPPPDDVNIRVTYHGQPLTEGFRAVVLAARPAGGRGGKVNLEPLPGLAELKLAEPDGTPWSIVPANGGLGDDGGVRFNRFRRAGGLPERMRLAIYVPTSGQLFVTDALPLRPYVNYLEVELTGDGSGTLSHRPGALAIVELYLRKSPIMGVALLITLALELPLVMLWSYFAGLRIGRMIGFALLGNVISLPLVWLMTTCSQFEFGLSNVSLAVFLLAEAAAALFEGFLYRRLGRAPATHAYAMALAANVISVVTGCIIVY